MIRLFLGVLVAVLAVNVLITLMAPCPPPGLEPKSAVSGLVARVVCPSGLDKGPAVRSH